MIMIAKISGLLLMRARALAFKHIGTMGLYLPLKTKASLVQLN